MNEALLRALEHLFAKGFTDQQIANQCHVLGSDLTMEMGYAPIKDGELIGIIRELLTRRPSPTTGDSHD